MLVPSREVANLSKASWKTACSVFLISAGNIYSSIKAASSVWLFFAGTGRLPSSWQEPALHAVKHSDSNLLSYNYVNWKQYLTQARDVTYTKSVDTPQAWEVANLSKALWKTACSVFLISAGNIYSSIKAASSVWFFLQAQEDYCQVGKNQSRMQ